MNTFLNLNNNFYKTVIETNRRIFSLNSRLLFSLFHTSLCLMDGSINPLAALDVVQQQLEAGLCEQTHVSIKSPLKHRQTSLAGMFAPSIPRSRALITTAIFIRPLLSTAEAGGWHRASNCLFDCWWDCPRVLWSDPPALTAAQGP